MGMDSLVPRNRNDSWTDEKHVHFLNSMEEWFVRTMLEHNNGRYNLRLDRQLPDSCESTLDCKHNIQTRKRHASSVFQHDLAIDQSGDICSRGCPAVDFIGRRIGGKVKGRPDKRSMRPSSEPHSSQDQVVPPIENRPRDKDEKALPKIPVASMAPAN